MSLLRTLYRTAAVLPLLYSATSAATVCNNSPDLCSKAYNNITYLGAHDSAFVRDDSTSFNTAGDQYYNTTVQLDAGVRLVTAQVHKANTSSGDEWHLCHTSCDLLDAGTLASWLGAIKTWMDANPNDVVTVLLVNSDDASTADLGGEFKSSGIDKYAYTPTSSTAPATWPTLQQLISNNTRLMAFVASLSDTDSSYPYLMDEFTYIFENNYVNESPTEFSCTPDRPSTLNNSTQQAEDSNMMFLMNHFLYSTELFGLDTPNDTYVNTTNGQSGLGSLGEAMTTCEGTYNKAPNYVLVDFFNVGPAISSVDKANGVTAATGRKSVPTTALSDDSSAAGRKGASVIAVVVAFVVAVGFGF